LYRKPDAGDPHVRFDERDLETELKKATAPDLDSTASGGKDAVYVGFDLEQASRSAMQAGTA